MRRSFFVLVDFLWCTGYVFCGVSTRNRAVLFYKNTEYPMDSEDTVAVVFKTEALNVFFSEATRMLQADKKYECLSFSRRREAIGIEYILSNCYYQQVQEYPHALWSYIDLGMILLSTVAYHNGYEAKEMVSMYGGPSAWPTWRFSPEHLGEDPLSALVPILRRVDEVMILLQTPLAPSDSNEIDVHCPVCNALMTSDGGGTFVCPVCFHE